MLSITQDSELMVQHVAAVAAPNSSIFYTVSDEDDHPIVFSVGTDNKFYMMKEDLEGHYQLSDFGSLLGFAEDYVAHALSVMQDAQSHIYVVLAIEAKSVSGSGDRKPSEITVLKPFKAAEHDLSSPSSDLQQLILPRTGKNTTLQVSSIFMIGSTGGNSYPPVLVAYQPLEYINVKEDLSRIVVSNNLTNWNLAFDVPLPEDASKILALQPLVLDFGGDPLTGLAALYILQNEPQLIFMSYDGTFKNSLEYPEDARGLASITNADGFSDLLVGGVGLHYFKGYECLRKHSSGREVCAEGVFSSIQELYVAQSPAGVTVWAADNRDGVGYLMASTDFTTVESPIPVIPKRQGGTFSVFKSATDGYEQILVSDQAGVLSLIRYDPALDFWHSTPFYTPALEKVIDIRCYYMQITVFDADKKPCINSEVMLKSSGYVDILVNGLSVQVSPNGLPIVTDQDGVLALTVPTGNISSYTFSVTTVDEARDSEGPLPIDPTVKVYDALSKIRTGDDLKNVKTQTGKSLLQDSKLSDGDIDQTAGAIAQAVNNRNLLLVKKGLLPASKAAESLDKARFGHNLDRLESSPRGIIDMFESAWHWLMGVIDDIVAWSVDAYHFMVRIGEATYRWALKTLEMIGNALSWIFQKILEVVEEIIEWIGFLFDWGDIQDTHRSIVYLTNSALDTWAERVDFTSDVIENYFDGLGDVIQNVKNNSLPEKAGSAPANKETADSRRSDNSAMDSTKVKWSQNQCTHGGAFKGAVVHDTSSTQVGSTPFEDFWSDILEPLVDLIGSECQSIGLSIFEIFNPADSTTPEQALSKLGTELLLNLLEGIKKLAKGLVKLGVSLLKDLKSALNYQITIPIFSWLYKTFLSGGSDLTVLDGLALILAIPVTIATKIITGKKPHDMTKINYSDIVDGKVSGDVKMQFNGVANVTGLCCRPIIYLIQAVESVVGYRYRYETGTSKQLAIQGRQLPVMKQPRGAASLAQKYWKDTFAVIIVVLSIPIEDDEASGIRWASWTVSALDKVMSIAARRVESADSMVLEKALGIGKIMLGAVNFGLIIAVSVKEIQKEDEEKDEGMIILECVEGTFDLVSSTCEGAAAFDPDPDTSAALELVAGATELFALVMGGTLFVIRVAKGEYNEIICSV